MCRLAMIGAVTASWLFQVEAQERQVERRQLPGASVESVVALAKQLSPELAAAVLDADAAAHRVGAAGVLADPTVTLQAWDVNGRGVGQRWIGAEQEFKLWGKLDLERGVAEADAEAARHQSRAVATDLIARVKTAYAQYGAAHRAIDLSLGLRRRLDEILALLRLRCGASSVDQQEVIKAEIEAATASRRGKVRLRSLKRPDRPRLAGAARRSQRLSAAESKADARRRSRARESRQSSPRDDQRASPCRDRNEGAYGPELLPRR
ncbi:MAG: outer membrane efflux protein [Methylocystaceae bacterium]|nr:MAG: outer membrane efflux protein [Methylocystaceae bacterium]